MANSIALFKAYINLIDEVYKNASTTAVLDGDNALVQKGASAKELIIPKIELDGLADHSRNGNFTDGNVTITHETVDADYDRDRRFTVDAMDNAETAGIAFGKLSSEFIRTKVVPEADAYRFAKYAGLAGNTVQAELADGAAALAALQTATGVMDDAEVPQEDRILFIKPQLKILADNVDTTKSRAILGNFSQIVKVPSARFNTKIELLDGKSTNETAGGYKKATDGLGINFMVISRSAVIQFMKHVVSKVITPEENQFGDGYIFMYRAYGYCSAYDNKKSGIYLHSEKAASAG